MFSRPKVVHVVEHDRCDHWVKGHFRGRKWIDTHPRNGSTVCEHWRSLPH